MEGGVQEPTVNVQLVDPPIDEQPQKDLELGEVAETTIDEQPQKTLNLNAKKLNHLV